MHNDLINGLFGFLGGLVLFTNVLTLYKDKQVKGYSPFAIVFFTLWAYWNLFYYSSLDQWLSFVGGISIAIMNTWWFILFCYYKTLKSVSE